ncbi:L-xylulose reductase-like [Diprion similis]|uniref:L-xylulose reductase-like n=1 Tax=Diprion similis TaxID=362088 RepID=UPI001EF91784|nr:L-xylulose reductase-like [Diprion similis]
MNVPFEGKRVLVTGAGLGIGRAVALRLSKFGANVIAVSLPDKSFDTLSKEDPKIEIVKLDLADWNATKDALQSVTPVDHLVSNAGILITRAFLDVLAKDVDASFSVNFKAAINVSQIVAKDLIARGKAGSIVNVSSRLSRVAAHDQTAYCCTKAAVDQLTRVMALELGPHNIRVNAVNPGLVMTDCNRQAYSDPEKSAALKSKIPLGRFAEVDEVVDAIIYLLSDRSSMINGVTLPVDEGSLAT